MLVSISGYGNSGASAFIDYLRGFEFVDLYDQDVLRTEFQIIHMLDGLNDLKYHLTVSRDRIASNGAIIRFKRVLYESNWSKALKLYIGEDYIEWADKFIKELIQVSWLGRNSYCDSLDIVYESKNKILKRLETYINNFVNLLNDDWNFPQKQSRFYSDFTDDEFDIIVKDNLNILFKLLRMNENHINIVDQLLSSTNPILGMEFIDNVKTIIVQRDPRDLYVTSKLHKEYARFMPNNEVYGFIKFYKSMSRNKVDNPNIMYFQYEDLIYNYISTTNCLKEFLGITINPSNEFRYFNPLASEKYTNRTILYKKYERDVDIIKEELKDYLYDFDQAKSPSTDADLLERTKRVEYQGFNEK